MSLRRALGLVVVAVVVLAVGLGLGVIDGGLSGTAGPERAAGSPTGEQDPESGLRWIAEDELPAEAADTLHLVDVGGPFPHPEDDDTFHNREGLLPDHPDGYYREYTVETPGEGDRGPRRIVVGEQLEFYWTEDHYASFERIAR